MNDPISNNGSTEYSHSIIQKLAVALMWVLPPPGQLAGELVKKNLVWSYFPQTHMAPSSAPGTLDKSFLSAVSERNCSLEREWSQMITDYIYL